MPTHPVVHILSSLCLVISITRLRLTDSLDLATTPTLALNLTLTLIMLDM